MPMLQDLDSLASRLRQLVLQSRDLQAERTELQERVAQLARERDALREQLDQREAEHTDIAARLAQHAQDAQLQSQRHAAELLQAQAQAGSQHDTLQRELFQCQGERDQAVARLQSSHAHSQRLRSAAQQAHGLVDSLLMRLPGAED